MLFLWCYLWLWTNLCLAASMTMGSAQVGLGQPHIAATSENVFEDFWNCVLFPFCSKSMFGSARQRYGWCDVCFERWENQVKHKPSYNIVPSPKLRNSGLYSNTDLLMNMMDAWLPQSSAWHCCSKSRELNGWCNLLVTKPTAPGDFFTLFEGRPQRDRRQVVLFCVKLGVLKMLKNCPPKLMVCLFTMVMSLDG